MDRERFRALLQAPWWTEKPWGKPEAAEVARVWWDAAIEFLESGGDVATLEAGCGSPAEFASGADWLSEWMICQGIDAMPLWDAFVAIDSLLEGETKYTMEDLCSRLNRASIIMRHVLMHGNYSPLGTSKYKPPSCPTCGSDSTKVASTKPLFRNIKCTNCDHTWKVRRYM